MMLNHQLYSAFFIASLTAASRHTFSVEPLTDPSTWPAHFNPSAWGLGARNLHLMNYADSTVDNPVIKHFNRVEVESSSRGEANGLYEIQLLGLDAGDDTSRNDVLVLVEEPGAVAMRLARGASSESSEMRQSRAAGKQYIQSKVWKWSAWRSNVFANWVEGPLNTLLYPCVHQDWMTRNGTEIVWVARKYLATCDRAHPELVEIKVKLTWSRGGLAVIMNHLEAKILSFRRSRGNTPEPSEPAEPVGHRFRRVTPSPVQLQLEPET